VSCHILHTQALQFSYCWRADTSGYLKVICAQPCVSAHDMLAHIFPFPVFLISMLITYLLCDVDKFKNREKKELVFNSIVEYTTKLFSCNRF
jgi:hypothetical protein